MITWRELREAIDRLPEQWLDSPVLYADFYVTENHIHGIDCVSILEVPQDWSVPLVIGQPYLELD